MPRTAALILFFGLLTMGCVTRWDTVARGTTLPVATLEGHGDQLMAAAWESAEAGAVREAFFLFEAEKGRRFRALQADVAPTPAALARPAEGEGARDRGFLYIAAEGEPEATAPVTEAIALQDERFWEEQRLLETRIARLGERGQAAELALRQGFPVLSAEETQHLLVAGQTLLAYLLSGEDVGVFIVTATTFEFVPLAIDASALAARVARLRAAILDITPAWEPEAKALSEILLQPAADALAESDTVTIIPDGFLANVPFGALGLDAPLIRSARVHYLPSASVYASILRRPLDRQPPRVLAVGDPAVPDPWSPLPAAAREARMVARMFPSSVHVTGAVASEERVVALMMAHNLFHFATHGLLGGNRLGVASSLVFSPGSRRDGYLTAGEIAQLDLSHGQLAVLSACETSAAEGRSTQLDSIAASFLRAGLPAVMGSLWRVSDTSTAALMVRFYELLAEQGAAEALRQAQLSIQESSAWSHPYHWAPFTVYGWDK